MILKKIRKDKKGVSPVIGVILMVAATIVIAAVVIAMLGGFTAPGRTYAVAAQAEMRNVDTTPTVFVTYLGGPDAAQVDSLSGSATDPDGNDAALEAYGNTSMWAPTGGGAPSPGAVATVDTEGYTMGGGDDHVIVTATFKDGSTQMILNTWI